MSGVTCGVQVRGRLPGEFRRYLWSFDQASDSAAAVLEVSYRLGRTLPEVDEFWIGRGPDPRTNSRFALFRQPEGFGLKIQCQGHGLFRITPDAIRIEWLPGGTGAAHYFFSYALPLWLELRGLPVLHASSVSFEGRAVAFVGNSGAGKSTLCDALVRLGAAFMADDGLALKENSGGRWQCFAGPPLLRLWPGALEGRAGIGTENLSRVHEGCEKRLLPLNDDCAVNKPPDSPALSAIYILDRQVNISGEVRLVPCDRNESVIRLIEFSLVAAPVGALGWTASRLNKLASVAGKTNVKRLVYPGDRGQWQHLKQCIVEDIETAERDCSIQGNSD